MKPLVIVLMCSLLAPAFARDKPDLGTLAASELMTTGRQAIERKDWPQAKDDLRAAISEEPGNADAHNLLAYAYRKQDKPDLAKAFEHYRIALRLNPQHRGAHEYIGEAYLMAREPGKAQEHLAALEVICGARECEEYQELAQAIADFAKAEQTKRPAPHRY